MPSPPLMLSDSEIFSIQDSVRHGVRLDGRALLRHREIEVRSDDPNNNNAAGNPSPPSGATRSSKEEEDKEEKEEEEDTATTAAATFAGRASVEIRLGETQVSATASASVFRDDSAEEEEATAHDDDDGNEGGGGAETSARAFVPGELEITLDAVPNVVHRYGAAVLGLPRSGAGARRAGRVLLSMLALTVRHLYGARQVNVLETTLADGVAAARELADDDDEGEEEPPNAPAAAPPPFPVSSGSTGFPAAALSIGQGFAFRLHVDVHLLEAGGGNVVTAVSSAVYHVLQRLRLPRVTLHKGPQGVLAEVDPRQGFQKPVSFRGLSRLVVLALSPTRHYVVDPTWEEEVAMPQQLHVGVEGDTTTEEASSSAPSRVTYTRYQQWPSRRGARRWERWARKRAHEAEDDDPKTTDVEGPPPPPHSLEASAEETKALAYGSLPPSFPVAAVLRPAAGLPSLPNGGVVPPPGQTRVVEEGGSPVCPPQTLPLSAVDFVSAVRDAAHVAHNVKEAFPIR